MWTGPQSVVRKRKVRTLYLPPQDNPVASNNTVIRLDIMNPPFALQELGEHSCL